MARLKLGTLVDEKPVRFTVEMPAATHRDLVAYAEVLAAQTGQSIEPTKLVAPMLARFMATDRGFASAKRRPPPERAHGPEPRSESA